MRVSKKAAYVAAYIILLHLVIVMLVFQTDAPRRVKVALGLAPEAYFERTANYHKGVNEHVPAGSALFFGDSNVQALAVSAVAPNAVNYGIGGIGSADLLSVIPGYKKSIANASLVVLSIGVNDVANGKAAGFAERYRAIVEALPASTPTVLSMVAPVLVAENVEKVNADITAVNLEIAAICKARPRCAAVDTWAIFAPNGKPRPEYFNADGVHLSPAGYAAWIGALRGAVSAVQAS